MIAIIDIIVAAGFGVAIAALFEGRWGPLLVATPLLGGLHALLFLLPAAPGTALSTLAPLADPVLLITAMVACATGSGLTALMLRQSRAAKESAFWLPDSERAPSRAPRPQPSAMAQRIERTAVSKTRRLVEEGYSTGDELPVFEAGDAPSRFAAGPGAQAARRPPEPPPEANKRRSARRRTVLSGRLCADGGVSIPCVIQNLSATGASVRLQSEIALPRLVSLIDVSNGIGHKAQVRWRSRLSLGVRFLDSFDLSAPTDGEAAALARQWTALKT